MACVLLFTWCCTALIWRLRRKHHLTVGWCIYQSYLLKGMSEYFCIGSNDNVDIVDLFLYVCTWVAENFLLSLNEWKIYTLLMYGWFSELSHFHIRLSSFWQFLSDIGSLNCGKVCSQICLIWALAMTRKCCRICGNPSRITCAPILSFWRT